MAVTIVPLLCRYLKLEMGESQMHFFFFFSYGYDEERSKVLYSNFKYPLPHIFQGTTFKNYARMVTEEKQTQELSKDFFPPIYHRP